MKQIARIFSIFIMAAMLAAAGLNTQPILQARAADTIYTVTKAADTADGICDADCSLREAITAANANSGADTILFDGNYTITLGGQLPAVTTNITITGNGAASTIIQADIGDNSAAYRVFQVSDSGILTLDGLSVKNGRCQNLCATESNKGAGIYNGGTLILKNIYFFHNYTDIGGAIYNFGTLTVSNTTFEFNSAGEGTGIGGAISSTTGSITEVTNSTFVGNHALTEGGGMYLGGTSTIINSTFSDNSSGISNPFGATLNLVNSIIANSTGADCVNGGTIGTENNNLIEDTLADACGLTDGTNSDIIGLDPSLDALTTAGYPTGVFPLFNDSPAINVGNNTTCNAAPVSNKDQGGYDRLPNGGATCDIGAYEYWDTGLPETSIDSKTPSTTPTTSTTMDFTFSGTDPADVNGASGVKSFECDVDGNGFAPCTSPVHLHDLLSKTYTFNVRAIDYVGNVDTSPATYTWTVLHTLFLPLILR